MARSDDLVAMTVRGAGAITMWASLLFGAALLCVQVFSFLKTGMWEPQGILSFLGEHLLWSWALMPGDWLGLHAALNWLNAGFTIASAGSFTGMALASFESA